jgi:excisionase family DNA binding protein
MTLRDACRVTGISKDAMYALIRAGELATFLMGHRRFIVAESLRTYIARRAAEPLAIRRGPNTRELRTTDGPAVGPQHAGRETLEASQTDNRQKLADRYRRG